MCESISVHACVILRVQSFDDYNFTQSFWHVRVYQFACMCVIRRCRASRIITSHRASRMCESISVHACVIRRIQSFEDYNFTRLCLSQSVIFERACVARKVVDGDATLTGTCTCQSSRGIFERVCAACRAVDGDAPTIPPVPHPCKAESVPVYAVIFYRDNIQILLGF